MTTVERIEAISDNRFVTGLSRLSMAVTPVLFTALLAVGWVYLDNRLDGQSKDTHAVSVRVDELTDTIKAMADSSALVVSRVVVLETNSARGRADREEFQTQVIADMREMRSAIVTLSNNVAALTATVEALTRRQSSLPQELVR